MFLFPQTIGHSAGESLLLYDSPFLFTLWNSSPLTALPSPHRDGRREKVSCLHTCPSGIYNLDRQLRYTRVAQAIKIQTPENNWADYSENEVVDARLEECTHVYNTHGCEDIH